MFLIETVKIPLFIFKQRKIPIRLPQQLPHPQALGIRVYIEDITISLSKHVRAKKAFPSVWFHFQIQKRVYKY